MSETREQVKQMAEEAVAEAAQKAVAEASAQGGAVVREPGTNDVNPYATRVRERHLADGLYLALQATCGHQEAVRMTCQLMGHDPRASRCVRCGVGISGAEARRSREQARAGRSG